MKIRSCSVALIAIPLASCAGAPGRVNVPAQPQAQAAYGPQASGEPVPPDAILDALARDVFEKSEHASVNRKYGLDTRVEQDRVVLTYKHDVGLLNSKGKVTKTIGYYTAQFTADDARTVATFSAPSEFSNEVEHGFLYTPVSAFDEEKLLEDVQRIHSQLRPVVYLDHVVNGEFETEFPDSGVYANYVRAFGNRPEVMTIDVEKAITFCHKREVKGMLLESALNRIDRSRRLLEQAERLRFNKDGERFCSNDQVPVRVSVYPYREGSMVKYSFSFAYSLEPDGTTTFNPDEIAMLEQRIRGLALE